MLGHVSDFTFMQITRLFFGKSTAYNRNQRLTVPPAAIAMLLTSQCPWELFYEILSAKQRA